MEKKVLNIRLYSSLIACDFLITRQNSHFFRSSPSNFNNFSYYSVFDSIEIIKSLKEFFYIFKSLSKLKHAREILTQVLDGNTYELINILLYSSKKEHLHISNTFSKFDKDILGKAIAICTLGDYQNSSLQSLTNKQFVHRNINLVFNFHMKYDKKITGFYNSSIDFNSLKKSVFFSIFLKKVRKLLNKKKKSNKQ